MLMDHEQGRSFVKGMSENIQFFKKGNKGALALIYENMLGYADLLTNHIAKENNILFRMADNVFTEENQHSLLNQFQLIDNGSVSGIPAKEYIGRIEILANIYLTTN